ncbi:MAG: carbohydrate-binding protein [Bacillota bacterium]
MINEHNKNSRFREGDQKLLAMRETNRPDGVVVDPVPITQGEEVSVLYYGLLSQAGADQIYLHTGYGDAHNWEDIQTTRMEKTARGWAKTFTVHHDTRLNICFKDSANNWDNNNGLNWSFEIHGGTMH